VLVVPPFRDFFNLHPLSVREFSIVAIALAGWTALVWISWRGRFVDRFLGLMAPKNAKGNSRSAGTGAT
jgi:cation-transporting P-type ATPase E